MTLSLSSPSQNMCVCVCICVYNCPKFSIPMILYQLHAVWQNYHREISMFMIVVHMTHENHHKKITHNNIIQIIHSTGCLWRIKCSIIWFMQSHNMYNTYIQKNNIEERRTKNDEKDMKGAYGMSLHFQNIFSCVSTIIKSKTGPISLISMVIYIYNVRICGSLFTISATKNKLTRTMNKKILCSNFQTFLFFFDLTRVNRMKWWRCEHKCVCVRVYKHLWMPHKRATIDSYFVNRFEIISTSYARLTMQKDPLIFAHRAPQASDWSSSRARVHKKLSD